MKDDKKRAKLTLIILAVICLLLIVVALTTRRVHPNSEAKTYDLNCLTELKNQNPLKECER